MVPLKSDQKYERYRRFPDSKSVYFCEFLHCFLNTQGRETAHENKQFKETKTWISNSYLITQSFQAYRCKQIGHCHQALQITLTVPLNIDSFKV